MNVRPNKIILFTYEMLPEDTHRFECTWGSTRYNDSNITKCGCPFQKLLKQNKTAKGAIATLRGAGSIPSRNNLFVWPIYI